MHEPEPFPASPSARPAGVRLHQGGARPLPHSLEAEEYLLSACLLDGTDIVARAYRGGIRGASFYDTRHGIIFEHLQAMLAKNLPIDIGVLVEELKQADQLEMVGGYAFLSQVSGRLPSTAQANYFIDRVFALSMLRAQIRDGETLIEECREHAGDIEPLLAKQALALQRRADFVSRRARESLPERMAARLELTLAAAAGQVDRSRWIYTGLAGLDAAIKPWDVRREHWYNIIAGPPSGGKSSFLRHIVIHNVRERGKRFAVFLLETGLMWTESAAATIAGVPLNAIVEGEAPRDMVERYTAAYRELIALADDRLFIFEDIYFVEDIERKVREIDRTLRDRDLAACAQIADPAARAAAEAQVRGLDGVVVDYLQIVNTRENLRGHREQIVAHISMSLKRLFKRLNLPGFVGAQISRAARESADSSKVPTLAALRESGAIEQDADSVIFVHTPPTSRTGAEQNGSTAEDEVEIGQRKRRNGVKDVAHGVIFQKAITRYVERGGPAGAQLRPGMTKPAAGGYKRPSPAP